MLQNDNVVYSFRGPMGIQVDIGSSILFLLGLILFVNINGSLVNGVIFIIMLVTSIFLHELGHAWGNKIQGIPVRRIMLHGFGGFCQATRAGTPREQELIVAMGPIVNLVLWALAGIGKWWIMAAWIGALPDAASGQGAEIAWMEANQFKFQIWSYLNTFAFLNIALFVFNMLPVQPLDGGKLFHLGMLRLMDPRKALRVTGAVGLATSVLWIPAAIYLFFTLGFILFFFPSIKLHWEMYNGRAAF